MPPSVELDELPAHVTFTVFVPAHAPDGPIHVDLRAARPRHGIPESAHISYGHWPGGDENEDFFVEEAAGPMHPRESIQWRREGGFETGEDRKVRHCCVSRSRGGRERFLAGVCQITRAISSKASASREAGGTSVPRS